MRKEYLKRSYQPGEVIETNVVGVTYEDRQRIVARLMVGDDVVLKREPNNPHDPNAIMVSVCKYTKAELEKFELDKSNINAEIDKLLKQSTKLHYSWGYLQKLSPEGPGAKEIHKVITQINERVRLLQEKRPEKSYKYLDKVQVGYINKDLAKLIAPIFDQWAREPAAAVDGKVIQLTGREKEDLTKGIRIRFKLPNEDDLLAAQYRDAIFNPI